MISGVPGTIESMRYSFDQFEFDSEKLLLTQGGFNQPMRNTEAKLLALLLEHSQTVLSKDEILSQIWQHKVVSEQVVFQNISHLRSLFGNEAIKTFPKRGYQWQLPLEVITPEQQEAKASNPERLATQSVAINTKTAEAKKRPLWQLISLAGILLIAITFAYSQNWFKPATEKNAVKLAYLPITLLGKNGEIKTMEIRLKDSDSVDFSLFPQSAPNDSVSSIELTYPKLAQTHPLLLTAQIRTYQKMSYLDFQLKGPAADWQGQLSGSSNTEVINQLQQHLKQLVIYDLLSEQYTPEIRQAKLSLAHQQTPQDLIVLRKLSMSYLRTNELDKAMVMADKLLELAQAQSNPLHIGRALLYQSNLLQQKQLHALSKQKLQLAIQQFKQINDLKHQAKAWHLYAWLEDQQQNYGATKASLLNAAKLALSAKDKLREVRILGDLILGAHSYQQHKDMYFYLDQLENKIKSYQLPNYHLASVAYYYALFSPTEAEKEPYLKQALSYTTNTPTNKFAQSSRRLLMQLYLKQNRLVEAQTLVDELSPNNNQKAYLQAQLAQANKQTDKMLRYALRAFEQAQLAGNLLVSLDMALLLREQEVDAEFYTQYIQTYASGRWRQTNQSKLSVLGL